MPNNNSIHIFSDAHGIVTKIDNILGHETSLNKIKLK